MTKLFQCPEHVKAISSFLRAFGLPAAFVVPRETSKGRVTFGRAGALQSVVFDAVFFETDSPMAFLEESLALLAFCRSVFRKENQASEKYLAIIR